MAGEAMEAAAGQVELLRGGGLDGGGDVELEAERGVAVAGAELDGDGAGGQALAGEEDQVLEGLDHVARVDDQGRLGPTAGCVAFPRAVFDRLLPRLGARPVIIIG